MTEPQAGAEGAEPSDAVPVVPLGPTDGAVGRATFRDPQRQARFARDGFVVVDLLDATGIAALRRVWAEDGGSARPGFHYGLAADGPERRRAVDRAVRPIVGPAVAELFDDHVIFLASFVTKAPGDDGEVGEHADWTFVDEQHAVTAGLWAPLQDCAVDDGALVVVPGSHRFRPTLRGTPDLGLDFDLVRPLPDRLRRPVPLRAGQAVVFDHRLLHGSPVNRGTDVRVAVGVGVKTREVQLLHHTRTGPGLAARYEISTDHLLDAPFGQRPAGTPVALVAHDPRPVSPRELAIAVADHRARTGSSGRRAARAMARRLARLAGRSAEPTSAGGAGPG